MQKTTTKYEVTEYQQWVAWEYQRKKKVPISPHTWGLADTTNSETWGTYEEALESAGSNRQVGFVFSQDDPFTGIDLDNCVDDGEVAAWALEIVDALNSYTEV